MTTTKSKVYRVVARIGKKRTVIFESNEFNPADGCSDYWAYKEAVLAREQYCMDLWGQGFSVTNDGRYLDTRRNIEVGHIEICRDSKK